MKTERVPGSSFIAEHLYVVLTYPPEKGNIFHKIILEAIEN